MYAFTPIILIILLSITGCAPSGHFENPNVKTQAQLDKDVRGCKYEVNKASASSNTDDVFGTAFREIDLYNECMETRGYVRVK